MHSGRMIMMKLFPVHPILWSSLLVLCALQSETEASSPDVCQEKNFGDLFFQRSPGLTHNVEEDKVEDNLFCLYYPTNILNCSWSFHTLQNDTQLFVSVSICDNDNAVEALNLSSDERVGSRSLTVEENFYVIFRINITLHGKWTVYTLPFDMEMLEVLSPPQKISASLKDADLLVTWSLPQSRKNVNPECFEYQLDMGDQEKPKTLIGQLSYTEPNADPTRSYIVRIRTRMSYACQSSSHWSAWSQAFTMEQSVYKLNTLVIVSVSLGIPMILLAVLLLVRHQRVTKILFPSIPRPPSKYKSYLEKSDTLNSFYPAPSVKPMEEEITEVEDAEQKPGKTL